MKHLKTYENVKIRAEYERYTIYETENLMCEKEHKQSDVLQVFKKEINSHGHFGFIIFEKTGEILFEIRCHQSINVTLTHEQIKELSQLMDYFKILRETEKYNI